MISAIRPTAAVLEDRACRRNRCSYGISLRVSRKGGSAVELEQARLARLVRDRARDVERREDADRPVRPLVEDGEVRDAVLCHQLRGMLEGLVAAQGDERRDGALDGGALVDPRPGRCREVEVGDEAPEQRVVVAALL